MKTGLGMVLVDKSRNWQENGLLMLDLEAMWAILAMAVDHRAMQVMWDGWAGEMCWLEEGWC